MSLIYPMLVQVLLTLVVLFMTGRSRVAALRTGTVKLRDIAVSGDAWPADVRKIANNYTNQFETPVLFFVMCGIAIFIGANGLLFTLLAWAFVATRLAHTYIHTGSNVVLLRFRVFMAGVAVLIAMLVLLAAHLATR